MRPIGPAAVVLAATAIVTAPPPVAAVVVLVVGLLALAGLAASGRHPTDLLEVLGLSSLVGLFAVAVALGTLGRAWSGPSVLLGHLDAWTTAGVAALATVVLNNLPAASLSAAHAPPHPLALLVGLDVGPNLFATGSLSWILWWRAARRAGAPLSLGRAVLLGALSAPAAMAAAVGIQLLAGRG